MLINGNKKYEYQYFKVHLFILLLEISTNDKQERDRQPPNNPIYN